MSFMGLFRTCSLRHGHPPGKRRGHGDDMERPSNPSASVLTPVGGILGDGRRMYSNGLRRDLPAEVSPCSQKRPVPPVIALLPSGAFLDLLRGANVGMHSYAIPAG
jgi:hypothetical protein